MPSPGARAGVVRGAMQDAHFDLTVPAVPATDAADLPDLGTIVVRGARTHNLKNVDVILPSGALVIITGVSGSGKSSLAFDTIYAEGQRRYVESLSAYARQFLERMEKPDVDAIDGVSPSIAIRQKNTIRNPRSTVSTTTEIHDYLRLLFARVGRTFCRSCGLEVARETAEVVAKRLAALPEGTRLLIGFDTPVVSVAETVNGAGAEGVDEIAESGDVLGIDDGGRRPSPRVALPPDDAADELDDTDRDRTSAVSEAVPSYSPGVWRRASPNSDGTPAPEAVAAMLAGLRKRGFGRLLVDSQAVTIEDVDVETLTGRSILQVVVDRVVVTADVLSRLSDSIEIAYAEGGGAAWAVDSGPSHEPGAIVFSERFECTACGIPYETPQPRLFSFNNPHGACPTCHGFGNIVEVDMDLVVPDPTRSLNQNAIEPWGKPHYRTHLAELKRAARQRGLPLDVPWADLRDEDRRFVTDGDGDTFEGVRGFFRWLERKKYKVHVRVFLSRYRSYVTCPDCGGARLRREALNVRVNGRTMGDVSRLTVKAARQFFATLPLAEREAVVAAKLLDEIRRRLAFLSDVGLDYLALDRLSSTLSGGESQRINLAAALGAALVGTLYVLDEPSIGLHPRDSQRLIDILRLLRDQGNTVLVVEHDADMIRVADHIVDLGLGAGEQGGRIIYSGPIEGLKHEPRSLTARYLRGELSIPIPSTRFRGTGQRIRLLGAVEHNLKGIDVEIPLNTLTVITGVSGSGKSTLVHDILYPALKRLKGASDKRVGAHRKLEGAEFISDVVLVDQSPIGRTPRSNPVTYLKAFDPIRELFAATRDAHTRGLTASHFSFNVPGGRCDACEGEGHVRVEMQFLADVFVPCEVCDARRFKPHVLEVHYRGKNIHQVLALTVREALSFFGGSQKVLRRLRVLDEIGLGYVRLGQPATTLSGGEAQRIKIAAHLAGSGGDRLLYMLDEPTTGLHFDDIAKLLAAFRRLLQAGHTLLVIEHNLDVIKTADYVIDLGPEGGDEGGRVVAVGTPEEVAGVAASHTGRYLRRVLTEGRRLDEPGALV